MIREFYGPSSFSTYLVKQELDFLFQKLLHRLETFIFRKSLQGVEGSIGTCYHHSVHLIFLFLGLGWRSGAWGRSIYPAGWRKVNVLNEAGSLYADEGEALTWYSGYWWQPHCFPYKHHVSPAAVAGGSNKKRRWLPPVTVWLFDAAVINICSGFLGHESKSPQQPQEHLPKQWRRSAQFSKCPI